MALYDAIDFQFSWDGDISRDDHGDIKDTSDNLLHSLIQEIHNIVKSETTDWEKDITLGANLSEFHGLPNNREVGIALEDRIRSAIINQGIVLIEDIFIKVVPIHANQVLIMVRVSAEATVRNGLVPGETLNIDLVYDSSENNLFFLKASTER